MIQFWLIFLGIALAVSNGLTWRYTANHYTEKADKLRMEQELANVAVQRQLSEKLDAAIDWYEDELAKKAKVRVVVKKEIQRVVESNPVYVDCKLDDAGVRLYNAAAAGVPIEPAPGGHAAVSEGTPKAQAGGNIGGSPGGSGFVLRDLPRVPSAPRGNN